MGQPAVLPITHGRWWGPLAFVALALSMTARFVPWPELATVLRWAQTALILTGVAVYARHGIRMRRGVWTTQSWRRFAASVVVSLAALALLLAFAAGVDAHAPWVGVSHSATRRTLGLAVTITGFAGVFMFGGAMERFAKDPADKQYESRLSRLWRKVTALV